MQQNHCFQRKYGPVIATRPVDFPLGTEPRSDWVGNLAPVAELSSRWATRVALVVHKSDQFVIHPACTLPVAKAIPVTVFGNTVPRCCSVKVSETVCVQCILHDTSSKASLRQNLELPTARPGDRVSW